MNQIGNEPVKIALLQKLLGGVVNLTYYCKILVYFFTLIYCFYLFEVLK